MKYGTRARIGMILPSVNQAAEPQISAILPDGVSLHTTRMRLRPDLEETVQDAETGAQMLADADVDLVVFHCTAASMSKPGFDDEVIERLEAACGKPATSTSKACLEAFETLDAHRIILTTPYVQAVNEREVAFLKSHGIEVLSETGAGISGDGGAMLAIAPEEWRRRVKEQDEPDAEACFISCTAVRSVEAIAPIEAELKKPVVTSNQAMVWHALRKLGIHEVAPGYGRLMETL